MTRRNSGWDYTQCAIYMITVTLADRSREWLGKLILAENGEAQNCAMDRPSPINGAIGNQKPILPQHYATNNASPIKGAIGNQKPILPQHYATNNASHSNGTTKTNGAAFKACKPHTGIRPAAAHSCATIAPTKFGWAALEALEEMELLYPQVKIIESQLMPEHMHFVIYVHEELDKPLSALIRGFKAGAAKRWKILAENGEARHRATHTHGTFIAKCDAMKACNPNSGTSSAAAHFCAAHIPQWAESFNDTILFRDGQLAAMINYVRDNPRRLAEKRANPELFSRVVNLSLPLDGGRIIGQFEALGNRHLLDLPLVQVQCSRRYFAYRRIPKAGGGMKIAKNAAGEPIIDKSSPEYESRLEAVLAAASHGAVVLSPCISDGERQIAREALKRNMRLVVLKNMGFAKCEKPGGRLFEACVNGRLLMLAPAAWPYSTQAKAMTRFDATALNRIAQWLAGECAIEVNYHGMQPTNVDKLAEEAIMAQR